MTLTEVQFSIMKKITKTRTLKDLLTLDRDTNIVRAASTIQNMMHNAVPGVTNRNPPFCLIIYFIFRAVPAIPKSVKYF